MQKPGNTFSVLDILPKLVMIRPAIAVLWEPYQAPKPNSHTTSPIHYLPLSPSRYNYWKDK